MNTVQLKEAVKAYLDGAEDTLQSDGFLAGSDVTFDQAKALLEDFVLAVESGLVG